MKSRRRAIDLPALGLPPLVALAPAGAAAYVPVVRGALTLDLRLGRRVCPLGPIRIEVAAAPETLFDVIADPYATAHGPRRRVHERGRTHRHALRELLTHERYDRILGAADTGGTDGRLRAAREVRVSPPALSRLLGPLVSRRREPCTDAQGPR